MWLTFDLPLGHRQWNRFVVTGNEVHLGSKGKKHCAHDYSLPETWKEHCWSPSMLFHSSSEVPGKEEERQRSEVLTGKQPKHWLWLRKWKENQPGILADTVEGRQQLEMVPMRVGRTERDLTVLYVCSPSKTSSSQTFVMINNAGVQKVGPNHVYAVITLWQHVSLKLDPADGERTYCTCRLHRASEGSLLRCVKLLGVTGVLLYASQKWKLESGDWLQQLIWGETPQVKRRCWNHGLLVQEPLTYLSTILTGATNVRLVEKWAITKSSALRVLVRSLTLPFGSSPSSLRQLTFGWIMVLTPLMHDPHFRWRTEHSCTLSLCFEEVTVDCEEGHEYLKQL